LAYSFFLNDDPVTRTGNLNASKNFLTKALELNSDYLEAKELSEKVEAALEVENSKLKARREDALRED